MTWNRQSLKKKAEGLFGFYGKHLFKESSSTIRVAGLLPEVEQIEILPLLPSAKTSQRFQEITFFKIAIRLIYPRIYFGTDSFNRSARCVKYTRGF
ncbi:hypothetical protein CEXT_73231 [Caerostris extrusa]|uniref:Uncharacterized protein n=1 Tax=Caerostris extrusa TaxID=172846 RepID=A0AAV4XHU3_CAEEX|nr:hypothetical protein CEXT_73231 [Caerostris extrusa]